MAGTTTIGNLSNVYYVTFSQWETINSKLKTAGDNPITISASELGLSGTGTITVSKLDDFRIKEEFITNMAEASSGTEQPITASAVYNYLLNGTSATASLSTQPSVSVVKNGTGLTFNFSIQQG